MLTPAGCMARISTAAGVKAEESVLAISVKHRDRILAAKLRSHVEGLTDVARRTCPVARLTQYPHERSGRQFDIVEARLRIHLGPQPDAAGREKRAVRCADDRLLIQESTDRGFSTRNTCHCPERTL